MREPLRKREKGELVLVVLRPRARANYVIMRDRVDGSNEPAASQRARPMNSDEYITSNQLRSTIIVKLTLFFLFLSPFLSFYSLRVTPFA